MAEFDKPRRPGPDDPAAEDDVYGLADDDPAEGDASDAAELEEDGAESLDGAPAAPGSGKKPAPKPPAPLPRLWKATPEPSTEARSPARQEDRKPEKKADRSPRPEPAKPAPRGGAGHRREGGAVERVGQVRSPAERPKSPPRKPARESRAENPRDEPAEEPKVLVEATPSFDTYEARRAVRVILGMALLGLTGLLGLGTLLYFLNRPPAEDENANDMMPPAGLAAGPQPNPEAFEHEARTLVDRAREAARKDDAKLAVSLLERAVKSYPNTQAAMEAREALARPRQNLPLFLDRPAVIARAVEPTPGPATPEPQPKVVDASPPLAARAGSGEVGIVLPAAPAEAPRFPIATPKAEKPEPPVESIGRALPEGFRSRPGTTVHETGWAMEILGARDGATMVLVPGGEFLMGQDQGDASERPAHRVKLSTFYVDQHEVTVRQFNLFQKEVGRRTDRAHALAREKTDFDANPDEPVVMVTAKEARDFATWAGKRLPTEAQWEMAARGADGRPYPWGIQPPSWGNERQPRQIGPVMAFATDVSPFGAYDMAGNAWEWTKDWYDPRYYFYLVKNHLVNDPTGPTNVPRSHQLALRGCSKTWTITRREPLKYDQRLPFLGFRCILQVEGPGNAFEPPEKPEAAEGQVPVEGGGAAASPPF